MIKCEAVFDGDEILVNDFTIKISWDVGEFLAQHDFIRSRFEFFHNVEQAIKYCKEN